MRAALYFFVCVFCLACETVTNSHPLIFGNLNIKKRYPELISLIKHHNHRFYDGQPIYIVSTFIPVKDLKTTLAAENLAFEEGDVYDESVDKFVIFTGFSKDNSQKNHYWLEATIHDKDVLKTGNFVMLAFLYIYQDSTWHFVKRHVSAIP